MKYIDKKDIKPGDIILTCDGLFISLINNEKKINKWVNIKSKSYTDTNIPCIINYPTKATTLQKAHLEACIKANKYVEPENIKEVNYEIY